MMSFRSLFAAAARAVRTAAIDSTPLWSRWFFLDLMGGSGGIVDQGARRLRGVVHAQKGADNRVVFGRGSRFRGKVEIDGSRNVVEFGEGCDFRGKVYVHGDGQTVRFGERSTAGDLYILCAEGCDVVVGRDCMISRQVDIRTTDGHSVIDRATSRRVNVAQPITIGDHVWIGARAIVSKGSVVPDDCIVGAMSLVNRRFEEQGTVIAGVPARVVERGITWHRQRRARFAPKDLWQRPGESDRPDGP